MFRCAGVSSSPCKKERGISRDDLPALYIWYTESRFPSALVGKSRALLGFRVAEISWLPLKVVGKVGSGISQEHGGYGTGSWRQQ